MARRKHKRLGNVLYSTGVYFGTVDLCSRAPLLPPIRRHLVNMAANASVVRQCF